MNTAPIIFDRKRVKQHRARAASMDVPVDFLLKEMAERLSDRLLDVARRFPVALDLGAHHGVLSEHIATTGKVDQLLQADISEPVLRQSKGVRVVADEELLPFAQNSLDLVISAGALHWVNDLPGALVQIQHALKADGLFLAILPGGQTLHELRTSFEQVEMAHHGGVSPRISPFIDVRDAGGLLQRAGFSLPVVDSETITVSYDHPLKLMHELRAMGQGNALMQGVKHFTGCSLMMLAVDHYLRNFSNDDGRINASIELVTLTAWKPHPSQQQPATRGSGKVHLRDVLSGDSE